METIFHEIYASIKAIVLPDVHIHVRVAHYRIIDIVSYWIVKDRGVSKIRKRGEKSIEVQRFGGIDVVETHDVLHGEH